MKIKYSKNFRTQRVKFFLKVHKIQTSLSIQRKFTTKCPESIIIIINLTL